MKRRPKVNVKEIEGIVRSTRDKALADDEYQKLMTTFHALVEYATPKPRSSEKLPRPITEKEIQLKPERKGGQGHGRNGADAYTAATLVQVPYAELDPADHCPCCSKGKVYAQKDPATLIRLVGQALIKATKYELEKLRCNLCGQIYTAEPPAGVGTEKYDATVASMLAHAKYGSGMPLNRLETLLKQLGTPLSASTQWELLEEAADLLKPVLEELTRQAAQGEVLHNDDTSMRVVKLEREANDKRTGVFTSGVVSAAAGRRIAIFFTGPKHAGENLSAVLARRAAELPKPIQMCDALTRNAPKLGDSEATVLANCLAHGRRHFVDVLDNFPDECHHVLTELGKVYATDKAARERGLSAKERLKLHQQQSGPVMETLRCWLDEQLEQKKTEPNSALGSAMKYLLRHWHPLTLFLRQAGAPLDNNVCERALKKTVLHRKNALFYRTMNGAAVGDLFMSLIHSCELNGQNPFDYLTELQRHPAEIRSHPEEWMPWNYRDALEKLSSA